MKIRYTEHKPVRGKDIVSRILRGELGKPEVSFYSKRYKFLTLAFRDTESKLLVVLTGTSGNGRSFTFRHPSDKFAVFTSNPAMRAFTREIFFSYLSYLTQEKTK